MIEKLHGFCHFLWKFLEKAAIGDMLFPLFFVFLFVLCSIYFCKRFQQYLFGEIKGGS